MRVRMPRAAWLLPLALALGACGNTAKPPAPERITTITTAAVKQRDLPVTESAVGAETAIVSALGYDPTRVGGTSHIRLSFPQHVATQLRIGQAIMLNNFATPDKKVRGEIREIRPALDSTTLSREVIVAVRAGRDWRPEGSVRGEVVLGVRKNALVVPEQAVVLRPAGSVIYVVADGTVQERPVKTGLVRDGEIEIVSGANVNDVVAVDGAAMLSEGAKVKVREPRA